MNQTDYNVVLQITTSAEDRRDEEKIYHNMTVADLNQLYPMVFLSLSDVLLHCGILSLNCLHPTLKTFM